MARYDAAITYAASVVVTLICVMIVSVVSGAASVIIVRVLLRWRVVLSRYITERGVILSIRYARRVTRRYWRYYCCWR